MKFKKNYKSFFGIIGIIMLILFIIPQTRYIPLIILFIPLSAIWAGPYMFLSYPFSIFDKIIYILLLILSALLIIIGIIKRKKLWWWDILIILGILLWGVLGLAWLGTGT